MCKRASLCVIVGTICVAVRHRMKPRVCAGVTKVIVCNRGSPRVTEDHWVKPRVIAFDEEPLCVTDGLCV